MNSSTFFLHPDAAAAAGYCWCCLAIFIAIVAHSTCERYVHCKAITEHFLTFKTNKLLEPKILMSCISIILQLLRDLPNVYVYVCVCASARARHNIRIDHVSRIKQCKWMQALMENIINRTEKCMCIVKMSVCLYFLFFSVDVRNAFGRFLIVMVDTIN